MRRRSLITLLIAFSMILAACASTGSDDTTTTAGPNADWPDEVDYGFIPSEKQETLADTVKPYMDYLTENIGVTFNGIITSDYNGLVVAMGAGNTDLGAFGPFGYVQAKEQYPEMDVLIQSIRFGSDLYHGQWFTNDPSICEEEPVVGAYEWIDGVPTIVEPVDAVAQQVGWERGNEEPEVLDDGTAVDQGLVCTASLDKVKGKKIAFTSATSTSGGVFPQLQLFNLGIDIENDVEYSYLTSHDATVSAVYNGDFDIGLSYDDARRTLRKDQTDVGTKVVVFNITDDIPNDVVAVRPGFPESLSAEIFLWTQKFLETEEGLDIFDEIYGWTGVRLARDEDFDVVREAAEKLGVTED